jgi:hypothetical protein
VKFGGKPPIVKLMSTASARTATSSRSSAFSTSANRPREISVIGKDRTLRIGFT